jgi:hypothetical protein
MNNHTPSTMTTEYNQKTEAFKQASVFFHLTFVNSVIIQTPSASAIAAQGVQSLTFDNAAHDYDSQQTSSTTHRTLPACKQAYASLQTPTKYCLKLSNNHSCTDDISQLFFKSLLDSKILTGSSVNSSYSSISFYASSVVKLKDWLLSGGSSESGRMSYNSAIHLVYSLSKQQKYLENNKLGFVCFNVDDIVVIDDSTFICVNPSLCEELFWLPPKEFNHSPSTHCAVSTARSTSSGKMTLCRPFNRAHCFCSPELLRIDSLPASVHHKTSYYSLGLLAIFCLFGYDGRSCSDSQQTLLVLQPILNTKLYFYLLRCLSVHAENRHLFFV